MVEEGKEAVGFTLSDSEGNKVSLESFKGKWVILYFYPKDMTPGCTTEACDFTELYPNLGNVVILGVSPDPKEKHQKFIKKHNLSITLLSDEDKDVLRAYGAWGIKKNYGKEYEGVIRSTFIINPEGNIHKCWRNVKATGHAKRVVDFLLEL